MNIEERIGIDEEMMEDYGEAYPVCPVIRRIAEELAEKYFEEFQFGCMPSCNRNEHSRRR